MLTYGCGNVTQDNAAVGGFRPPASETNEFQPPNTNNDVANVIDTALLGRVANSATTRIGGPASGGLDPVNLGLTMAAEVLQATVKGSVGAMTMIRALMKNMGGPTTNTQGVQLPSTQPTQQARTKPTTKNFLGN